MSGLDNLKYWKCPHCQKTEITDNSIGIVLCPFCGGDCFMNEYKSHTQLIIGQLTKGKQLKGGK